MTAIISVFLWLWLSSGSNSEYENSNTLNNIASRFTSSIVKTSSNMLVVCGQYYVGKINNFWTFRFQ
jgi:hypothetical protein